MTNRTNWWERFFEGLIVDFWRAAMVPEATRAEADFLDRHLALSPGARVLDVPCGDGRLAWSSPGADTASRASISRTTFSPPPGKAPDGKGSRSPGGNPTCATCRGPRKFDDAFCGGSSFGFLGDEGDAAFVAAVFRALAPGARFAIDAIKAAEVILPQFRERNELALGDLSFVGENRYDHETGWIDNRYTITRGDRSETRQAAHRIYTHCEAARMLEAAGFYEWESLGSLDGEPFRLGSPRLILVARKRT